MGCGSSLPTQVNADHENFSHNPSPNSNEIPNSIQKSVSKEKITESKIKEKNKQSVSKEVSLLQHIDDDKPKNKKDVGHQKRANGLGNAPPESKKDLHICDPKTGCCVLKSKRPLSATEDDSTNKISQSHDNALRATLSPKSNVTYDNNQRVPLVNPSARGEDRRPHSSTITDQKRNDQQESPTSPHHRTSSHALSSQPLSQPPVQIQNDENEMRQLMFLVKDSRDRQDLRRPETANRSKQILTTETRPGGVTDRGPREQTMTQPNNYSTSVIRSNEKNAQGRFNDAKEQQFMTSSPFRELSQSKDGTRLTLDGDIHHNKLNAEPVNPRLLYQPFKHSSVCYSESDVFTDAFIGISFDKEFDEFVHAIPPGYLFEDADFPAETESLFYDPNNTAAKNIEWLRPFEILSDDSQPELVCEKVSRNDIMQGILGDCWFLSCCASIIKKTRAIYKVVPKKQVLCGPAYRGVVRFRFWIFGHWVQVLIDDRLPTVNGKLIYSHCTNPTEFWVALIEKAYAKIHGCYEALGGGITKDAFVDLTGGVAERYEITDYNPQIYKLIFKAHRAGGFVACSRKGDWRFSNVADANGLVQGHAYTIVDAVMLYHKMGVEKLLRIKNPWGDGTKWKGSWSDYDVNWQWVDEDIRDKLLNLNKDGEFWISFRDFIKQFGEVTICHLTPDLDGDGEPDEIGHMETIKGEWIMGKTAGGSRNNLVKFVTNDQYLLTILEPDNFNIEVDDAESEGKCNVVIALMQECRTNSKNGKAPSYQIGFFIYESDDRIYKLPLQFFRYNPDFAKTNVFINYREVSGRFELYPGHYVIIPTTFLENCPAHFMLRVFGEKRFLLRGPLLPHSS